jgi:proline iminopeptidase
MEIQNRHSLFPEIEPYKIHHLKVSSSHELYVEEVGNPDGQPVVFLHGGPGAGLSAKHRRYFDPKHYRIILFDQRGSGKSTPHASLEDNTTWDLVNDIEKVREAIGVKKWLVFGGSWGSTLALCYAETHPESVTGLVLRGIFLCRKEEIDWFYQKGCDLIFPDSWERYSSFIPEAERGDMIRAYYKRLTSPDERIRLEAARSWSTWEGSTIKLIPDPRTISDFDSPHMALSIARIECHFFLNKCWFKSDNYIIENIEKIRHIPSVIIHGRYDVVCPVKNAWDLHKAWPESKLEIVPDAGHAADEPGIMDALIRATDNFRK